jgi:hypothetical protein
MGGSHHILNKKYVALGVILIAVILIPVSYVIALDAVSDAVYGLGFDSYSGTMTPTASGASFRGDFVWANNAALSLTIDQVKIAVFVTQSPSEFEGTLFFGGPPAADAIRIGNVLAENVVIPASGKGGLSGTFEVASEEALNLIRTGNYSLSADYVELKVSGTHLFWHFAPPIYFM